MKLNKDLIRSEEGLLKEADTPIIISASRVCDIPAFSSEWLINRLRMGYTIWQNPFNSKKQYISFSKTKLIVFWTKNPNPLIKKLPELENYIKNYYFHYTINDYNDEKLETGLPDLKIRIETFKNLSEKIGRNKVIWRFDPLILAGNMNIDNLISSIESIGNQLYKFTNKLVISFADINEYTKVKKRFLRNGIKNKNFKYEDILYIAHNLEKLNRKWKLNITTCAENVELKKFKIYTNKCIDDELIKNAFCKDSELISYVTNSKKDKEQRKYCNCIKSKDIGLYGSCNYKCIYCYAG